MAVATPANIDEYVALFPKEVQEILEQIRKTIIEAAPGAAESISYAIPTFKLNGRPVIYFAGYKNHIGLYPVPRGNEAFTEELSAYKGGKGTARFPLNKPIPLKLITKIVKFRLQENLEILKTKKK